MFSRGGSGLLNALGPKRSKKRRNREFEVFGKFVGSDGSRFPLLRGYREHVWNLDWEAMNRERAAPTRETVRALGRVGSGRSQAADLSRFMDIYGFSLRRRDVLEVGCFDGAASYALREAGAGRVHGIDAAKNFVVSDEITESGGFCEVANRRRQAPSDLIEAGLSEAAGRLALWGL